ncbi:glycine--tRNA ligase subunit beta [Parasphingopyxis lamellibrachiae]|uniref:Glycine--tRNA ligase beta subunit n=1 Tax=Parasphingopyxis lamellibrachiae TaxID=680125 RepID=A0A3D9FCG8_9SPHN|nr:glycine--tRNA ligase subunit beta [Parasphingopyxis lamellibrachiae]RED15257.1 glycyl-tRNA synthetase beta chain [Parasphingopyxis lamellibrachiae]
MADFLFELLSEEIPARMQGKARADLERLFTAELDAAGLKAESIETWSTPRRLTLIARELPMETEAVREERKGPKADAPDQAVDGFLRSTGLMRDDLETRDVKGKPTYFAVIDKPGRATADVLGEAIPTIIRAFPWPKSMRWGAASVSSESQRWVRPLQGIVAILGEQLVACEIDGIASGYETVGHRFHHDGPITIGGADDYVEKLRACHVIVDHKEREGIIRTRANALAEEAGLVRKQDPGLVEENAGLTEWPVPLLGSFDESFLEVAPEAITLAMRSHQKYFACEKPDGSLSPHFICVANIEAADEGAHVVAGNEKVLAARLSDAKFFWEQDQKVSLSEHAKKLDQIVFHEKLGTVADKVDRVAKLAGWLVEADIVKPLEDRPQAKVKLANDVFNAASLAKADLVTGMVGEFADLQGVMGGYYAANEGLDPEVSAAIRDHYKPVGQGDDVPTAPVTVAVSLADKLDALVGFFASEMPPTGSKDPFALRRAMIGAQALTEKSGLRFSLTDAVLKILDLLAPEDESGNRWIWGYKELSLEEQEKQPEAHKEGVKWSPQTPVDEQQTIVSLRKFFADRLKVQQREAGVRHDLIDAVFALGGEDDLVRLLARVKALQAFLKTADGANLLAGYKRAANILKKEEWEPVEGDYNPEPEEALLLEALNSAEPKAATAIAAEDFEKAMAALATLRKPIDAFFEKVTVNDDDLVKRASRLDMLARFRDAVHSVADFSKIEG